MHSFIRTLGLVFLVAGFARAGEPYSVSIDGKKEEKPHFIHLFGKEDDPKPGDLVWSGECYIPLEEPGTYSFSTEEKEDEPWRLYREVNGTRVLIGVKLNKTSSSKGRNSEWLIHNDLKTLTPEQLKKLRYIGLEHWDDDVAAQIKHIDAAKVFINLRAFISDFPGKRLPVLPAELGYLTVNESSSNALQDVTSLGELKNLKFLAIDLMSEHPVDAKNLKDARGLRILRLNANLTSPEALEGLVNLQVFRLGYSAKIDTVAFAANMKALRSIVLPKQPVKSLEPLGGLPELAEVYAADCEVDKLPEVAIPKLKSITLFGTRLSAASVAAFRKLHPKAQVRFDLNESLQETLAPATVLRIRSGGTCHRNPAEEKVLYEEKDAAVVKSFATQLRIEPDQSGFHCMCCGEPTFEFYRDAEMVAMIGFHHGQSLRWVGGWPGDGMLTKECRTFLVDFLAEHGVKGPKEEMERQQREAESWKKRTDAAFARLRPEFVELFKTAMEDFGNPGGKEIPLVVDAKNIPGLLFVYGQDEDGNFWSSDTLDGTASRFLNDCTQEALAPAATQALLGNDPVAKAGAIRLWVGPKSPLNDWKPADKKLYDNALDFLLGSEKPELRKVALRVVGSWALSAATTERILTALLKEKEPSLSRSAVLKAGRTGYAQAIPVLMEKLNDPAAQKVPQDEGERIDSELAPRHPEAALAALALGYLRHEPARAVLTERAAQDPLYSVALALMGETERLKEEHFASKDDNQPLQLAAVEAVVRAKGATGIRFDGLLGCRSSIARPAKCHPAEGPRPWPVQPPYLRGSCTNRGPGPVPPHPGLSEW